MTIMRTLLLISSSNVHGFGYLDHAEEQIRSIMGTRGRTLFVPFALKDRDAYATKVRERLAKMEIAVDSLHEAQKKSAAIEAADAIFIGGGNTFRLLKELQDLRLLEPIARRVAAGMPYVGSSAGINIAAPTIRTTNDMPIVQPTSFGALNLVPFQINPHYLDPDPQSTHKGETREQRIKEFHEENAAPVLGIREGAMLRVEGEGMTLRGIAGARLFRPGEPPAEFAIGANLDFLLRGSG